MSRVLLIALAGLPFCLAAEGIAPAKEKAVREEAFVATLQTLPERKAAVVAPQGYACEPEEEREPLAGVATEVATATLLALLETADTSTSPGCTACAEVARATDYAKASGSTAVDAPETGMESAKAGKTLAVLDTEVASARLAEVLAALETEMAGAAYKELTQPQTLEDIGPVAANQLLEALKTKDYAAVNAVLALPKLTRWEAVGRFKVLSRLWAIQQRAIKKEKRGENTDAEWESFAETERLADSIAERMKAAKVERK